MENREKGQKMSSRAENRRADREKRLTELKEQGVPKVETGQRISAGARVPRNMDEVRALLSGRYAQFREPITRKEERAYTKVFHYKGKGFTKPLYSGDTKKRKEKQNK